MVKTHRPSGDFDAVIMLIRNPYRAMMSYHTWKVTKSHVSRAGGCGVGWVGQCAAVPRSANITLSAC